MDDLDLDFKVVRRNLNVISVLILLLAFSDAKISEVNFLNIKLALEGPKLYVGIYILYLYFAWRYLTKLNFKGDFWSSFRNYYLESNAGVKRKYPFEKMKTKFFEKKPELQQMLEADRSVQIYDLKVLQLTPERPRELRLSQNFYRNVSQEERAQGKESRFSVEIEIKVTRLYIIGKMIWFSFRHDKFGDYIFPIIPLAANMMFFVFNDDWQGSFNQIFKHYVK